MEKVAFINGGTFVYWSSIILTIAVIAAIAFFAGLYLWKSKNGMTEPEFSAVNTAPFGRMEFDVTTVETDGENLQHVGVMRAFAGAILRGEKLVADGREGINGLTLSNAMHLSAFTGKKIELDSFDHELYRNEIMKRVATSKRKVNVSGNSEAADLSGTYGS